MVHDTLSRELLKYLSTYLLYAYRLLRFEKKINTVAFIAGKKNLPTVQQKQSTLVLRPDRNSSRQIYLKYTIALPNYFLEGWPDKNS